MARTSITHPLEIAEVKLASGAGVVGVTFCPGKTQASAFTGSWTRDLGIDLDAIRTWGAAIVLTLVTAEELVDLQVAHIGKEAAARGMTWLHLPIIDVSTPTKSWEQQWDRERGPVHQVLDGGGRILVHCKGGLGRAGLVAAKILIERGEDPSEAMAKVRSVRPGAIETRSQEAYLTRGEARLGEVEPG